MYSKAIGKKAEQYVAQVLRKQGYVIRAYNYQKKCGEVDLIAAKDDVVAFIEVKFRNNPLFDVSTVITRSKQKKMIAVAKYYMAQESLDHHTVQFDVALVSQTAGEMHCEYIENAFQE